MTKPPFNYAAFVSGTRRPGGDPRSATHRGPAAISLRLDGWQPTPVFDYIHCNCGGNDLYTLSPAETIAKVSVATRPMNDAYVLAEGSALATTPPKLKAALAGFGRPDGPDVALIDLGSDFVKLDSQRHMPVNGRRNAQKPFGIDEVALLGIVQAAGFSPFSLIPEAGLDLFMPVFPDPKFGTKPSSKTAAALGWHIDNMPFARPYRPDVVALMGLVSSERVVTKFALLDDVLETLDWFSSEAERVLREPRFRFRTPASFHFDGSEQVLSDPIPVICDDSDGRPMFNFNEYSIIPDRGDLKAIAALNSLSFVFSRESIVREEWVSPGKVLLLSNTRVLHARSEVRGMRYLARLYGKRDLSALRALPSGGDRAFKYRFMMTPAEMLTSCRCSE